jgi:hypothetical protein
MNILETADELTHLQLVVHFNELSPEEAQKVEPYRNKVEVVSFRELLVCSIFYY